MDCSRDSIKKVRQNSLLRLLIISALIPLLCAPLSAQPPKNNKLSVLRDVAQKWMAVGKEQYNRGQYTSAEQSFLNAMDYQQHLTKQQLDELEVLLAGVRDALLQRQNTQKAIEAAEQLIETGQLFEAKAKLENLLSQTTTSLQQQKQIENSLNKINYRIQACANQMDKIYKEIMAFYQNGRLDNARQNLLEIDAILSQIQGETTTKGQQLSQVPAQQGRQMPAEQETKKEVAKIPEEKRPAQIKDVTAELKDKIEKPEQAEDKKDMLIAAEPEEKRTQPPQESLSRKEKIVRSYIEAIVNDATEKVRDLLKKGNFQQALKIIDSAGQIVNQNRQHLGEETYNQYKLRLNALSEDIAARTKGR